MKFIATIEARMKSTRLQGKVLLPIMGKPMLELMIERLKYSKKLDGIVVATTVNPADDKIVDLAKKLKVGWHRGSDTDVLIRVLEAATKYRADLIVELTGDCPLVDPAMIDEMIECFQRSGIDYLANNTIKQLVPRGFDVQVFPQKILKQVSKLTGDPYDHEHVSLYIYEHPEKFKIEPWGPEKKLRRNDLRLTVDTVRDFELIKRVFHLLFVKKQNFSLADVVALFEQFPGLASINSEVEQKKARYTKREDRRLVKKAAAGSYDYIPKLRAAIVGCGNIAGKFDNDPKRSFIATHAGAFQTNSQVSLVAACDVVGAAVTNFGRRWGVGRLYQNYRKMFTEVKPDIVSICTTPESHYPVVLEAVRQKIPIIICEKPFGNNPKIAAKLAQMAKLAGVMLLVHYNRRFDKWHRQIRDEIKSGKYGDFLGGTIYYSNGFINNGCHAVDLALMMLGEIKKVQTVGSGVTDGDPTLDVALTLKNGKLVTLQAIDVASNYLFEADLMFKKMRLKFEDLGRRIIRIASVPHPRISGINAYEGEVKITEGALPQSLPALVNLLTDKKQILASNAADAAKVLEVLAAARMSWEGYGGLIKLPLPDNNVVLSGKAATK
jgi:spore coat polysaccharide biosynthesis protein SpsF (cytidylyltransferase family)/predicted dehydrogenase